MPNPIVTMILQWSQTYRTAADNAFNAVADAAQADPTSAAKQLDFKQALQAHSAVMNSCASLAIAAMDIVAAGADATLSSINQGTAKLQKVLDNIKKAQRVIDVAADLATTAADVLAAIAVPLDPSKIATAASELETLVKDTIGGGTSTSSGSGTSSSGSSTSSDTSKGSG